MPFYIRKSFGAGPLRLNLSKSGFGISAGVTGARVGLSSDGRAYVHGGRHGLYYRKYFSKTNPGGDGTLNDEYIHTGVTYPSSIPKPPQLVEPQHWWGHPIIPLFAAGLCVPLIILQTEWVYLMLFFLAAAVGLRNSRKKRAKQRLEGIERIQLQMDANGVPNKGEWPQQWVDVAALDWVEGLLADHRIDELEKEKVEAMLNKWPLSAPVANHLEAVVEYYHGLFLKCDAPLKAVDHPTREPKRGETIFLEVSEARFLNLNVLKRYQRQGVRFVQRGFEIDVEGVLRITSRVFELDDGYIREYKLKHIRSVELRVDDEILEIQLASRKNPIYLSTPELQEVAAVLKRVMDEVESKL